MTGVQTCALPIYKGKCENVHGHNYRVQVTVEGEELQHNGLLVDFAELKRALRSVSDRLDHQWINDMPPFTELNPSAENIAKYIYEEVSALLGKSAQLQQVRVWETDTSLAVYRRS